MLEECACMGLFRRKSHNDTAVAEAEQETSCPHIAISPRWDNPEDMGHEDLASAFVCQACGATLTPEESRAMRV
jgi:hypothetical protein